MGIKVTIKERLALLRCEMSKKGITVYYIPTADAHDSEYVCDYFKVREYFSGFTGSNGTLIIFAEDAFLFTDGRYFIQAEQELLGSQITLMRMGQEGVPSILEFIKSRLSASDCIGFDGMVVSADFGEKLSAICQKTGSKISNEIDLAGNLIQNRTALPCNPIWIMSEEIAGKSVRDKREELITELDQKGLDGVFFSRLDDIMWLFNLRGSDIDYNPVALSYAYVTKERMVLFLQTASTSHIIQEYAKKNQFEILPYEDVQSFLKEQIPAQYRILVDPKHLSSRLLSCIRIQAEPIYAQSPVEISKAVKNEIEIEQIRKYYVQDSVAVIRLILWLKEQIGIRTITEMDAAEYLMGERRKIQGYLYDSFPTISAYGANAAMMHYEPSIEKPVQLLKKGMLLVDSGGQYMGATTDVTRTILLGTVSEEEKLHFTKTACGMLALLKARFLEGCTGRNLDILARNPLWKLGIDYQCGTGHGVGFCLNVHEGPQGIRWKPTDLSMDAVIKPGMLVTDEPGVYVKNRYGIRTENVLLCRSDEKNEYGQFLNFETLTFVPIDLDGILPEEMQEEDRRNLNEYHQLVYQKTAPFLNAKEKKWLQNATREI